MSPRGGARLGLSERTEILQPRRRPPRPALPPASPLYCCPALSQRPPRCPLLLPSLPCVPSTQQLMQSESSGLNPPEAPTQSKNRNPYNGGEASVPFPVPPHHLSSRHTGLLAAPAAHRRSRLCLSRLCADVPGQPASPAPPTDMPTWHPKYLPFYLLIGPRDPATCLHDSHPEGPWGHPRVPWSPQVSFPRRAQTMPQSIPAPLSYLCLTSAPNLAQEKAAPLLTSQPIDRSLSQA